MHNPLSPLQNLHSKATPSKSYKMSLRWLFLKKISFMSVYNVLFVVFGLTSCWTSQTFWTVKIIFTRLKFSEISSINKDAWLLWFKSHFHSHNKPLKRPAPQFLVQLEGMLLRKAPFFFVVNWISSCFDPPSFLFPERLHCCYLYNYYNQSRTLCLKCWV